MKVKIDIETKTFVRLLLIVVAFVAAIFLAWKLWTALMIIIISVLLALALNPPVSALASRLPRHSRMLATAIAYIVVVTVIGVFMFTALPPIIDQTNRFIGMLPQYIAQIGDGQGWAAELIDKYNLQEEINSAVDGIRQQASDWAYGIGNALVAGVTSILTGIVTLIAVLVLTFLLLLEGPRWFERLWGLYVDGKRLERHQHIAAKMYKVVSGYVNGQLLIAGIASVVGMAVMLLLTRFFTVPSEAVIPLAGVIFVTTLIPMIGSTIGAIIITGVLVLNDWLAALIFLVFFIIYQQIENNFIQPVVQARTVALSALSVFVAVIIGINLLGIIGGILAIPVAGCIRVLLEEYEARRKHGITKPARKNTWSKLVSKDSDK